MKQQFRSGQAVNDRFQLRWNIHNTTDENSVSFRRICKEDNSIENYWLVRVFELTIFDTMKFVL